jgi:aminoacylase
LLLLIHGTKLLKGVDKHKELKLNPMVFSGATDSRYIREVGINAFGYTQKLLHDNNEFFNEKIFLKGIDVFYDIIN